MGMVVLAALADELGQMLPETKYLLLRIVQRTEAGLPIPGPARALANVVGLDERKVSKALHELLSAGILKRAAARNNAPGRPVVRYTLATAYRHGLRSRNVPMSVHIEAIEELLKHERSREMVLRDRQPSADLYAVSSIEAARARRTTGQLTVVNRLVLAILLSRADRFGRVGDIGRFELSRLTGLSSVNLKSRIDTLIEAGLIRAYVPGATSSLVFKKTYSVYYLNLNHTELASGDGPPTLLVSTARYDHSDNRDSQADDVFIESKHGELSDEFAKVRKYFLLRHERRIAHVLQSNLDRYAGFLLSNHWGVEREHACELEDMIKADLMERPQDSKSTTFTDQALLVEYLCEQATYVVSKFKDAWFDKREPRVKDINFGAMDYVLLPLQKAKYAGTQPFYPSRAVLALPRDGSVAKPGLYVAESVRANGDSAQINVRHVTDPERLPSEELGLYGLRARPKMVVRIAQGGQLDWVKA